MLWAFKLEKATDVKTGKPIEVDTSIVTGYREGLTASANEFQIKITVRGEKRRLAIEEAYKEAQETVFKEYESMNLWSK
jgi:hypothetical protein